jgi:hypothetical protein
MSSIIDKIIKFISDNPLEEITAMSVIYKIIEDIPTIQKKELLEIINSAIQIVQNNISKHSDRFKKLKNIPKQVSYY